MAGKLNQSNERKLPSSICAHKPTVAHTCILVDSPLGQRTTGEGLLEEGLSEEVYWGWSIGGGSVEGGSNCGK
eukprot:11421444-Karenia_brevis.AAC.1